MKTMAQMKVGSTGMFVGRTTTDCRFENKVGSEMLHIAYRKPEWQWDTEVDAAEKSMVKGECKIRQFGCPQHHCCALRQSLHASIGNPLVITTKKCK
jgi:hypothetical protein